MGGEEGREGMEDIPAISPFNVQSWIPLLLISFALAMLTVFLRYESATRALIVYCT